MIEWRFVESEQDGQLWLNSPTMMHAFVDYSTEASSERKWRRIMVVTKSWVLRQLEDVRPGSSGGAHALVSAMLVLPDAPADQLRRLLSEAIASPGVDRFSTELKGR